MPTPLDNTLHINDTCFLLFFVEALSPCVPSGPAAAAEEESDFIRVDEHETNVWSDSSYMSVSRPNNCSTREAPRGKHALHCGEFSWSVTPAKT